MTIDVLNGSRGWQFIKMEIADLDEAMQFAQSSSRPTSLLFDAALCRGGVLAELASCRESARVRAITLLNEWPDLTPLEGLVGLESLTIGGKASRFDFSRLRNLTEVGGVWSPKWTGLDQCQRLKVFAVSSYRGEIADLPRLPALERLSLIQTSIKSLQGLQQAQKLVELDVSYAKSLSDISELSACRHLEVLLLSHCKRIESFDSLIMLKNLRDLGISDSGQIPSIMFIQDLAKLETLGIYGTKVLDGDLQPCIEHPSLLTLLSNNDRGYKPSVTSVEKLLAERVRK